MSEFPDNRLSEAMIERLCDIVKKGNYRYTACKRIGLPYDTLKKWVSRGRQHIRENSSGKRGGEGQPEFPTLQSKLVLELDKAEGECHGKILEDVLEKGSTADKRWFLEHRYAKQYSRNPNAVIDDEAMEVVEVDPTDLLLDRLRDLRDAMDRRGG